MFGLFRDQVPAVAMRDGGQPETVRQRQGVVPDLAIKLPTNHGPPAQLLCEVKIISAGPSRYPRGSRDKAVDRRARALPGEYRGKLANLDRQYHGTVRGQVDPCRTG